MGHELFLFRFRRRAEGGRRHFRRGRAGGAPLGLAGRRGFRRRGRGSVRSQPAGPRAGARMGRFLHRGDDRLCRQPDARRAAMSTRPCRLADRPRSSSDGAPITPTELALGRQDAGERAQRAGVAQGLGARPDRAIGAGGDGSRRSTRGSRSAAPDRLRRRRRRRAGGQRGRGRDAVAAQGRLPPSRQRARAGRLCSCRRSATI